MNETKTAAGEATAKPTPATVSGVYEPVTIDEIGAIYDGRFPTGKGGYLREIRAPGLERADDPRVSSESSRQFGLRGGEQVTATIERSSPRTPGLLVRVDQITQINGRPAHEYRKVKPIEDRTRSEPYQQLRVETSGGPLPMRVIDLLVPIGFGQRGLIIAPPRSGKTILLEQIAHGAAANHPNATIITLLIDERPEEVTEIRRSVPGEVIASSVDREAGDHVRLASLVVERAKRLVEMGKDVLILIDSLTRLARAFHSVSPMKNPRDDGTVHLLALTPALAVIGAAQNIDEGGSLTILATLIVDDDSELNAAIARELSGACNWRLVLSRELVEARVWPAIDLSQSSTDHDELMLSSEAIQTATSTRREAENDSPPKAMKRVLAKLRQYETNEDLVLALD